MGIRDFTIYDIVQRNAQVYADKTAWLEAEDRRALTFSQWKDEADRLAAGLRNAGVRKGDRIGVVGKNCMEFFLLFTAAAALGAIVVPINWRLSAEEGAYNLLDTSPTCVLTDNDAPDWLKEIRAKVPSGIPFYNLQSGAGPWDDLDRNGTSAADFMPEDVGAQDGLVIIHTAAVGGRPRGALLSHANLICCNQHLMHCFNLQDSDVHLNLLPLFHVAGLCMALVSFHAGALNINMRKFDAERAVSLIGGQKVSVLFEFAPILKSILDAQAQSGADLSSLRAVMGLDAPETIERYQKVTGGTFHVLFGQTETSLLASMGRYNDCPGSAGRPLPVTTLALLDEQDRPVPAGQVGEIATRGPMVFKGYWNLETENAATFRSGWHHTGDLGRMDANGFLWYAGRKPEKELIKPGGENVYPAEVEKVILENDAVEGVVVFGIPDPKWKEAIKAVCVLKPGKTLTAKALIDFVGARIARYKKPQVVEFVAELPRTAAGSVDRAKVKARHGGA